MRGLFFWTAIAVLTALLLWMARPFVWMAGFGVYALAWLPFYHGPWGPTPWWTYPFILFWLALVLAPLVWVGRLLIQAYRHAR